MADIERLEAAVEEARQRGTIEQWSGRIFMGRPDIAACAGLYGALMQPWTEWDSAIFTRHEQVQIEAVVRHGAPVAVCGRGFTDDLMLAMVRPGDEPALVAPFPRMVLLLDRPVVQGGPDGQELLAVLVQVQPFRVWRLWRQPDGVSVHVDDAFSTELHGDSVTRGWRTLVSELCSRLEGTPVRLSTAKRRAARRGLPRHARIPPAFYVVRAPADTDTDTDTDTDCDCDDSPKRACHRHDVRGHWRLLRRASPAKGYVASTDCDDRLRAELRRRQLEPGPRLWCKLVRVKAHQRGEGIASRGLRSVAPPRMDSRG